SPTTAHSTGPSSSPPTGWPKKRPDARSARPREALDGSEQVLALARGLRGVARGDRVRDAVPYVVLEQLHRDALERGRDGGDLRQDVDAVPLLLDHPLDAPHLALDPVQALDERILVLDVAVGHAGAP